jgi:hypothetical protein
MNTHQQDIGAGIVVVLVVGLVLLLVGSPYARVAVAAMMGLGAAAVFAGFEDRP